MSLYQESTKPNLRFFPLVYQGRIKTNKGEFFFNQARHSKLHPQVFDIWMQICFGKRFLSLNNAVFSHNS